MAVWVCRGLPLPLKLFHPSLVSGLRWKTQRAQSYRDSEAGDQVPRRLRAGMMTHTHTPLPGEDYGNYTPSCSLWIFLAARLSGNLYIVFLHSFTWDDDDDSTRSILMQNRMFQTLDLPVTSFCLQENMNETFPSEPLTHSWLCVYDPHPILQLIHIQTHTHTHTHTQTPHIFEALSPWSSGFDLKCSDSSIAVSIVKEVINLDPKLQFDESPALSLSEVTTFTDELLTEDACETPSSENASVFVVITEIVLPLSLSFAGMKENKEILITAKLMLHSHGIRRTVGDTLWTARGKKTNSMDVRPKQTWRQCVATWRHIEYKEWNKIYFMKLFREYYFM